MRVGKNILIVVLALLFLLCLSGMKIITQGVPGSASKILPKPSQISTPSGTPVVVVSAGSSQSSSVAMVTRTGSSVSGYYFLCCFLLQFNSININFVYQSTSAHLKVVNLRS